MADVFTHFNYLHTIPEIGMKEFKTSAYVADVLKQLGYEVETQIGGATGVVAVCDSGKPGPVLGLRADMDALGTKDGGAAHLCGHDGHMAMLLAAAEEIMEEKLVRKGKLKLLFQPAEETSEGALSMLKGGAVDDIEILIGSGRIFRCAPQFLNHQFHHVIVPAAEIERNRRCTGNRICHTCVRMDLCRFQIVHHIGIKAESVG